MKKYNFFELDICRNLILLLCSLFIGCSGSISIQKQEARKVMVTLMNSYADALKERNVEKISSLFLRSPEFMIYSSGKSLNYDEVVAQFRDVFPNFKSLENKWDTIFVSVLNSNAIAAAAPFHEVITDKNGNVIRLKGETTWIAVRVENNWKFIYGHGFEQPDTVKLPFKLSK
jgi:hypothetical protein